MLLLYHFSILYLYGQCFTNPMENRQYNLRSANRDTVSVPLQLQIGNTDIMSTVLNQTMIHIRILLVIQTIPKVIWTAPDC